MKTKKTKNFSKYNSTKGLLEYEFNICKNTDCRLRKAGCKGFKGCPGYKS